MDLRLATDDWILFIVTFKAYAAARNARLRTKVSVLIIIIVLLVYIGYDLQLVSTSGK